MCQMVVGGRSVNQGGVYSDFSTVRGFWCFDLSTGLLFPSFESPVGGQSIEFQFVHGEYDAGLGYIMGRFRAIH